MTRDFSPLATRIIPCSMYSSRNGTAVDHILDHHQAGTDSESVARAMASGSKQVSANYIITNEGEIWGVIPETLRAWTSGATGDGGRGAAWDRRSITVEVENESAGGDWPRSSAASAACARLYADVAAYYGFSLTYDDEGGGSVIRHRQLYEFHDASYPTACNGGVDMAAIVAQAITPNTKDRSDMNFVTTRAGNNSTGAVTGHLFGEFSYQALVVNSVGYNAAARIYAQGKKVDDVRVPEADIVTEKANVAARLAAFRASGAGAGVDLTPVLQAIAAGEAQDAAGVQQILTSIAGVDEATLATFGLKRA